MNEWIMYQTVWILVLLECTWTTLTLPFLHLPYLILIHRSIMNWNILISGLNLNVTKTELTITSLRQKLQSSNDYTINIDVDDIQVNQTIHSKSLGLNTDNLSWKAHIQHVHDISKKVVSESDYLFPSTMQLKYTNKVLLNHTLIIVLLSWMACCSSWMI